MLICNMSECQLLTTKGWLASPPPHHNKEIDSYYSIFVYVFSDRLYSVLHSW